MERRSVQTDFKAKVTRRFALLLSILYLANPLHRPLQMVLHETIAFFESPGAPIDHTADDPNERGDAGYHTHKTLQLEQGHKLVDFIGLAMDAAENGQSSDESIPKSTKIDKHVVALKINLQSYKIVKKSKKYFFPIEKSDMGHPMQFKEPPQLF